MPTYQALVDKAGRQGQVVLDGIQLGKERRQKIVEIQQATGRPLIVYFANFIKGGQIPNNSIDDSDLTAFSDLIEDVQGDDLDLLLHTPGGVVESAERIVGMLRARFKTFRVIVPHSAYSAGTLISFAADQILMDDRSALGPIDPQLVYRDGNTGEVQAVPAQAITAGFQRAIDALKDAPPEVLKAYLPMLNKLSLHLLEICKNSEALTSTLAMDFLRNYMFRGEEDAGVRAEAIAKVFSSHDGTKSHRRSIRIEQAKELGLKIIDLRGDKKLRQAIWELHCQIEFFVDQTADTAKFYENAFGVSWRRRFQVIQAQFAIAPPSPPARDRPRPGGGKR